MNTGTLDQNFMELWTKLNDMEKESLVNVAKNYIHLKDEQGRISIEQYNQELDEAMKRMDEGEFYTHEQVVSLSKNWVNGE